MRFFIYAREKSQLQESVAKLENALTKLKCKENDTSDAVKRSLDAAEHAQYEKTAAELEIRRLKDELERQHSKLRDAITDQVSMFCILFKTLQILHEGFFPL